MMRILPGTIRECSGPPVSVTAGSAGYHPGVKTVTQANPATPAEWGITLSEGQAVLMCHGYLLGTDAGYVPFRPYMQVQVRPDDYFLNYQMSTASFVFCAFLSTMLIVGNPDYNNPRGYPLDLSYASMSPAYFTETGWFTRVDQGSQVIEVFGQYNSLVYAVSHDMPINGGKVSKHLPLFY